MGPGPADDELDRVGSAPASTAAPPPAGRYLHLHRDASATIVQAAAEVVDHQVTESPS